MLYSGGKKNINLDEFISQILILQINIEITQTNENPNLFSRPVTLTGTFTSFWSQLLNGGAKIGTQSI